MTIKEIAQLAGVSSAAVSRYMNGGYISAEKKEQIRKVIEETGYQPSAQARILRTGKANLIGVVAPKINSESISRITAGNRREPLRYLLARILRSLTGIDFQKNIALLRRSALKASPK